ncbi:helix-turn-helix domain-containing protein [Ruegeria lacuscaerulensis]|uniref:helix-turn-helix domain-containing protein n=1 Tax=Ruegeria lacuscaerulensis TaxID=55218 RepID=UPI001481989A|nr:helix-turn-helix domain-containing protein [Ruegeria lacuscaerulensis]
MDHIKNRPNPQEYDAKAAEATPSAIVLDLMHPNDLAAMTPWELDFRQLDPGPLSTQIAVRSSPTCSVLNISLSGAVHQRGVSPDGWSTFGISRRGTIDSWQGCALDDDAFLTFGNKDGFDGVSTGRFFGNVVSFNTRRFQKLAQCCGYSIASEGPALRLQISDGNARRMDWLEREIANLLKHSDEPWNEDVEEALMIKVLAILTSSAVHQDKSSAQTRRRALNRALEMMNDNALEPVSIEDLCAATGASLRTLNRAFNERFGYGPKAYYMRLRLDGVREDLLNGAGAKSIADIANKHGFWHMGQFARDYRLFFGELPSETQSVTVFKHLGINCPIRA